MRRLSEIVQNKPPVTATAATTVRDAGTEMRTRDAGSIMVVDEAGKLTGIFTGRDAVQRVLAEGKSPARTKLGDVMTPRPRTASPDQTGVDALHLMWNGGFSHVPVVEGDTIRGLVSHTDICGEEESRHGYERELWEHMR